VLFYAGFNELPGLNPRNQYRLSPHQKRSKGKSKGKDPGSKRLIVWLEKNYRQMPALILIEG
jgi:hypothetical protein